MTTRRGPLAGLRVLDTATLYAAPFIATLLADHGADVIKVEPPGGDPYRHQGARMWSLLARNKRSIELDLTSDEGRDLLLRLVATVDVVVVNMPVATLAKRGLTYEIMAAVNPDVIFVHVTGFGLDGPYCERPGNGTTGEALGGLTYITGEPDGRPMLASVPLGDAMCGFTGAFGALVACYDRLRNGAKGCLIDVNPFETALHAAGPAITEYAGGAAPRRLGGRLGFQLVRNTFATADGEWVAISLSTDRHVRDMAALVGHDDFDADGNATGDLEGSVATWVARHARAEAVSELVRLRVPVSPVQSAADVLSDPHARHRGSVQMVLTGEDGPVANPAPAPRLVGRAADLAWRTPDLDEHRQEILQEIDRPR